MYDTEGNKRICIIDNLSNCQQPHQHTHLKKKRQVSYYKNSKIPFLKRNFHVKSLTCFKNQINVIVVPFVLWKFLSSN